MAYLKKPEIVRVELPTNSEYWVDVDTSFKWGQVKELMGDDGELGFTASADKMILLAIKSWNLTDENDQPLEISATNIDQMERDDVLAILGKINLEEADTSKKNSSKQ